MGIRGHELVLHPCLYMYAACNIKMTQKKPLLSHLKQPVVTTTVTFSICLS